jgi:hypothetical protein
VRPGATDSAANPVGPPARRSYRQDMTPASSRIRAGLALVAITGLLDLTFLIAIGDPNSPKPVVIANGLNGLVTLAGVAYAWRGHRGAMYVLLAALVVDLLLNVPVYFVGSPGWVVVVATAILVFAVAGVGLAAPLLRRRQAGLVGS